MLARCSLAFLPCLLAATPVAAQAPGEAPPIATMQPLAAAPSLARPLETPWRPRFALTGHVGLGTPYGGAGLELERGITRWLSAHAGFGKGFTGMQFGGMLRARIPMDTFAVSLGTGLSIGQYEEVGIDAADRDLGFSSWFNADVAVEWRWDVFTTRVYAGRSTLLSHGDCRASAFEGDAASRCSGARNSTLPYLGLALGIAF